jgi:hypothetical protein
MDLEQRLEVLEARVRAAEDQLDETADAVGYSFVILKEGDRCTSGEPRSTTGCWRVPPPAGGSRSVATACSMDRPNHARPCAMCWREAAPGLTCTAFAEATHGLVWPRIGRNGRSGMLYR